mmetsp:Transcript_19147/g.48646  ORF Transcript_19147/g.48646 Transcript_19147/m.48646 type:complete len:153 (+) Transcript_19147:5239-5697(+)
MPCLLSLPAALLPQLLAAQQLAGMQVRCCAQPVPTHCRCLLPTTRLLDGQQSVAGALLGGQQVTEGAPIPTPGSCSPQLAQSGANCGVLLLPLLHNQQPQPQCCKPTHGTPTAYVQQGEAMGGAAAGAVGSYGWERREEGEGAPTGAAPRQQ